MSANNIDSQSFNAKSFFKNFVKDKSVEEVIRKNNDIFSGRIFMITIFIEIRTLDSEL